MDHTTIYPTDLNSGIFGSVGNLTSAMIIFPVIYYVDHYALISDVVGHFLRRRT